MKRVKPHVVRPEHLVPPHEGGGPPIHEHLGDHAGPSNAPHPSAKPPLPPHMALPNAHTPALPHLPPHLAPVEAHANALKKIYRDQGEASQRVVLRDMVSGLRDAHGLNAIEQLPRELGLSEQPSLTELQQVIESPDYQRVLSSLLLAGPPGMTEPGGFWRLGIERADTGLEPFVEKNEKIAAEREALSRKIMEKPPELQADPKHLHELMVLKNKKSAQALEHAENAVERACKVLNYCQTERAKESTPLDKKRALEFGLPSCKS